MKLASATVLVGAALALAPAAGAATFTVNTIVDGPAGACDIEQCTLREAILAANTSPENDLIAFSIGTGLQTIRPTSQLPNITGAGTTIDGTTQPGFATTPVIELSGELIEVDAIGLLVGDPDVPTSDVTIRGLTINRFRFDGIRVGSAAVRTRIERNWLGLDASGTIAARNRGYGVLVWESADDTLIGGGADPAQRHLRERHRRRVLGRRRLHRGRDRQHGDRQLDRPRRERHVAGRERGPGVTFNDTRDGAVEANVIAGNTLHGVLLFAATDVEVAQQHDRPRHRGPRRGQRRRGRLPPRRRQHHRPRQRDLRERRRRDRRREQAPATRCWRTRSTGTRASASTCSRPASRRTTGPATPTRARTISRTSPCSPPRPPAAARTGIIGEILTGPTADYRIDFYASATCDSSGNGEGARWLGSTSVATNVDGFAEIDTDGVMRRGHRRRGGHRDGDRAQRQHVRVLRVRHRRRRRPSGTFTVNSANNVVDGACDATHCSLNEAINAANAAAGPNTIRFAVGTGPITIQPALPLPIISGPTVLDGTTQPGFSGRPIVFVDGINAGANATGFFVSGGQTTIRGSYSATGTAPGSC